MKNSHFLETDRQLLTKHITCIQQCREIEADFFMNLSTITSHITKYHTATPYDQSMDYLNSTAHRNHDYNGKKNYMKPFLYILKTNLKYVDKGISSQKVNKLLMPQDPPKYRTANYQTGAAASAATGVATGAANKAKCSACQGDHSNLLHCPKLPSFISGRNSKAFPKSALIC